MSIFPNNYLTIDTDWAEMMSFRFIGSDRECSAGTIFNTLRLLLLELCKINLSSFGIHPNFYPLLQNHSTQIDLCYHTNHQECAWSGQRTSHGLNDSTAILDAFYKTRMTQSQIFIPFSFRNRAETFSAFLRTTALPYFYEEMHIFGKMQGKRPPIIFYLRERFESILIFIHPLFWKQRIRIAIWTKPFQREYSQLIKYITQSTDRSTVLTETGFCLRRENFLPSIMWRTYNSAKFRGWLAGYSWWDSLH
jgi:hypothetical protein